MNGIKRIIVWSSFILIFACFPTLTFAQEAIDSFSVDVVIQENADVRIEETIAYDFGDAQRHGIYRSIPYRFDMETAEGTNTFEMNVTDVRVVDKSGKSYMFDESRSSGDYEIKIGDPDATITGKHTYVIAYTLTGALRYFSDHDELYLNAIGPEWGVPIAESKIQVSYPYTGPHPEYRYRCFKGFVGSTNECQVQGGEGRVQFESGLLYPGESMTVVIGMPKGVVDVVYPQEYVPFEETLWGKIVGVLIILGGIIWYTLLPFWIVAQWWMYGRDPDVGVAPTAHFEAPKDPSGRELTPAETGLLIDEKVHKRDVLSTVVDLARRGHVKIVEKKKNDFYLQKDGRAKEKAKDLPNFEVKLLTAFFEDGDEVSLKKTKLASTVQKVEEMLYENMLNAGFFHKNPKKVRTVYEVIAVISIFFFNIPLLIAAGLFGRAMPRKTVHGAKEANKAKGLYAFLKSQERQLNFEGADPQVMFEKLLPYAVAFGVEKQWMQKFEDIDLAQPEWYHSSRSFNQANMMSGLQSSFRSFNSAATPASSSSGFSSGGGFSGGGVGGGGGGSW